MARDHRRLVGAVFGLVGFVGGLLSISTPAVGSRSARLSASSSLLGVVVVAHSTNSTFDIFS